MAFAGQTGNYGQPTLIVPELYRVGFKVTNDATTPNSIVNVGIGQCRDSTDTFQIVSSVAMTAVTTTTGLNALDTGTVAANTLYAIYVVGDPVSNKPTGLLLSTNHSVPLMPYGYSIYRLIDFIATDGSSNFYKMFWSGSFDARMMSYGAPAAATYTPATSATQVVLTRWVPAVSAAIVTLQCAVTPATAGNTLSLGPTSALNTMAKTSSSVLTVAQQAILRLPITLVSGVPSIYATSTSASDTVVISVMGVEYYSA